MSDLIRLFSYKILIGSDIKNKTWEFTCKIHNKAAILNILKFCITRRSNVSYQKYQNFKNKMKLLAILEIQTVFIAFSYNDSIMNIFLIFKKAVNFI